MEYGEFKGIKRISVEFREFSKKFREFSKKFRSFSVIQRIQWNSENSVKFREFIGILRNQWIQWNSENSVEYREFS